MFSTDDIKEIYNKVHDLLVTRHIIRTYSSNSYDIRDIALNDLDLSGSQRILELGCGYGFFVEKLKDRLHKDAVIIGIDLVENNRLMYLNSVATTGYRGEFIRGHAELIKNLAASGFDLIIASYSLYFFPELIKDIARILNDHGVFITITHSKHSLKEVLRYIPRCLKMSGLSIPEQIMINRLFMSFSGENGRAALNPYFKTIEKIDYKNILRFSEEHIEDCIYYIVKKRNFIFKEVLDQKPELILDIESCLANMIQEHVRKKGSITLNKNDMIFRCYNPLKV
jgi:ubiquinone/menaquinone biosynthesis C-methylase UbiE